MKNLILGLILLFSCAAFAQPLNITPQPVKVVQPKIAGKFELNEKTQIVVHGYNQENSALFLKDFLRQYYGLNLLLWMDTAISSNAIHLNYGKMEYPIAGAYMLQVNKNGIYIDGDNETGVFYGMQTLLQLLPPEKKKAIAIPFVNITDYPRFAYRGMMLDCGRHFLPVSFIKSTLDYLAMHKMNYFHWHLTEDQGWRIEIKKYPLLTSIGSKRNGTIVGRYPGKGNDNTPYGGYYTQDEIRDIVAYAAKRYITVVPEIEMPGHSAGAIAAYPFLSCFPEEKTRIPDNMISEVSRKANGKLVQESWGVYDDVFCAGKDSVFEFLQDVIDEVAALFPSPYIHVGADECPKSNWKRCPRCQQRIKDEKLKDEHELQSYFISRMEGYINKKGKTLIGWDEILEGGLAPNAVVMSWRGEAGGIEAAKQKHQVIMTPTTYVYLDYSQTRNEDSVTIGGYIPIQNIYNYNPIPKEMTAADAKYVLGAQGNVWTEYMDNKGKVEYMIFPRLSALSECLWSPQEKKNFGDFERRLPLLFQRYAFWGASYSKAYYDLKATIGPTANYKGIAYSLDSKDPKARITVDMGAGEVSYSRPVLINQSASVTSRYYDQGGKLVSAIPHHFQFNKATGKKITLTTPPAPNYPGDGAFTLVNGIVNEKGLSQGSDFLGFEGNDASGVINFGVPTGFSKVQFYVLEQTGSWIYRPASVSITYTDSKGKKINLSSTAPVSDTEGRMVYTISLPKEVKTNLLQFSIKNYGTIPEGMAGAGHKAWLFVHEIGVE